MGKEDKQTKDKKVYKKTQPVRYNSDLLIVLIDYTPRRCSLDSKEERQLSMRTLPCSRSKGSTTRKTQAFTSASELLTSTRPRPSEITQNSELSGEESSRRTATPASSDPSSLEIFLPRLWEQLSESCCIPTELFEHYLIIWLISQISFLSSFPLYYCYHSCQFRLA